MSRLLRRAGTGCAVAAASVLLAVPAAAHDGAVLLEVAGDGATGITVLASWEDDGHPVEDPVTLSATALGVDGVQTEPFVVQPTGEGQGFYSAPDSLGPGTWDVTVTASSPRDAQGTAQVAVTEPEDDPQDDPAAGAAPVQASGSPPWTLVAGGALVLVAVGVVALRRRAVSTATATATPPTTSSRTTRRPLRKEP